jgi:hypothetical protein
MNVSVRRMRGWLPLVVAIAACGGDPSLQIEVQQPEDENYKRLVTKTVVTVYESELDTLTCEQVELGDVTAELLLGAAVAQQTVYKDGRVEGTLDDISRLGKKVIVARMLTDDDILIAAGCAEQGDLDGDTRVVVQTIVAASVAVDTVNADDPYGKQITLVDPLGDSLVGRPVRWRLFSPSGAVPAASDVTIDADEPTTWSSAEPGCTDNRGIANMRLTPPSKVAGFAARFRVSWPAQPIDVISGFVRPAIGAQLLDTPPASNRCAIRTAGGERRVVCAETVTTTPRAHRYEIAQGPLKNYSIADRGFVAITQPAGVFAFDGEVYALRVNATVQNLFGATSLSPTPCADCAVDDFRVAPACGDDPARIFFHSATGSPIRAIPVTGGAVQDLAIESGVIAVNLNAAGCVTTINAQGVEKDVQVIVLDLASQEGVITRGFFRCGPARVCNVTLPFPNAGVGFVRAGTATKPEMQMIGTAFDIAGAELVGWVLRPTFDNMTYLLIDRRRIIAAAPPVQLLVGKLDNDAEPDLVWNMRGTRSSLLQVSYGHTIEDGSRLSALAPIPTQVAIEELALGDLNGDGFDDLVGVTPNSFIVLPQNVDGPAVMNRTTESTCAP